MTTFNCYHIPSSTDQPILRPWPKCGLVNPPNSIIANVVISGECDSVGGEATYNGAVFAKVPSDLVDGYVFKNYTISWIGGLTGNKYDSSSGFFSFTFGCIPYSSNNGLCSYNYHTKTWNFSGGFRCFTPVFGTNEKCWQSIEIIGIT